MVTLFNIFEDEKITYLEIVDETLKINPSEGEDFVVMDTNWSSNKC